MKRIKNFSTIWHALFLDDYLAKLDVLVVEFIVDCECVKEQNTN